ncbi:hypothetical protein [Methylococcus geothermalis]|uniref:Transmembrane protein n=1 Tax=Methylococcus geothermalis TaxID=2681310 RepID=A0A858QAZ9_9GAMM|nr:hypothetical protein [Methylococcus geothermalis]QJD30895.1 hypothetical protein GNH96_13600 [Methylococcus geothermalis]
MDSKTVVDASLARLDTLLAEDYGAKGQGLADRIRGLTAVLPADTRKRLLDLVAQGESLARTGAGERALAEFVFDCGVAYERVDFLRKAQLAEDLGLVGMNGLPPAELERSDLDAMARFIAARDRLVAKVASFTLKALAVMGALFVIGLVFGVV